MALAAGRHRSPGVLFFVASLCAGSVVIASHAQTMFPKGNHAIGIDPFPKDLCARGWRRVITLGISAEPLDALGMGTLDVTYAAEGIQARMYRNAGFCPDVPAPIIELAAASRATIRMVRGDGAVTLRTRTIDVPLGLPRSLARLLAARGLAELQLADEDWRTAQRPLSYAAAIALMAPRAAFLQALPSGVRQLAKLFVMPESAAILRLADVTSNARPIVDCAPRVARLSARSSS
jgi:hypothetical protein